MSAAKRIVVTGMSVLTPLADNLEGFLEALLAGRSAIARLRAFDTDNIYVKVGGDLTGYDEPGKLAALSSLIPEVASVRLRRLMKRAPWAARLSMLLAVDAWLNAGLFASSSLNPRRVATLVAGHNINANYQLQNTLRFLDEPDFMDGLFSVFALDTSHASLVSEVLQLFGPMYTVGGACASGNHALRSAIHEIRSNSCDVAVVLGAVSDFAAPDLHALALVNAISCQSFNDEPERASRPFDVRREGFVPAHGGAVLVLEELEHARRRDARIYGELLAAGSSADGNHQSQPNETSQADLMTAVLAEGGVAPEAINYLNAHATSTPLGDVSESRAIGRVFGRHTRALKVNATKSMLGHTIWASAVVEIVGAILQMNAGRLHPSINVDQQDEAIDLDVCSNGWVPLDVEYFLKNAFGFGGYNAVSLFGRYDGK
ncbi:MAG: beta-ketoacyl-[acyl-carrier-protein] synthase family protein [Gammaproteobacteria bacterium]